MAARIAVVLFSFYKYVHTGFLNHCQPATSYSMYNKKSVSILSVSKAFLFFCFFDSPTTVIWDWDWDHLKRLWCVLFHKKNAIWSAPSPARIAPARQLTQKDPLSVCVRARAAYVCAGFAVSSAPVRSERQRHAFDNQLASSSPSGTIK